MGREEKKRREISFEVIAFDFVGKGAPIVDNVRCTSTAHPSVYSLYISGIPDRPQPLTFISFYSRHHNLHYNYFSVLFSRRIMIALWRVMKLIPSSSFSSTLCTRTRKHFTSHINFLRYMFCIIKTWNQNSVETIRSVCLFSSIFTKRSIDSHAYSKVNQWSQSLDLKEKNK